MKITELKPNKANPRTIKDDKFRKLVESIQDFPKMMALRPIVIDADGTILGGNMRYRALVELGYKEIPDGWVKRASDLTDDEKRRFIIEDNVPFGQWDWDALGNDWDEGELEDWGLDVWQPMDEQTEEESDPVAVQEDDFNEDGAIEVRCKKGDIWQLGKHRLMCGDSADFEQVRMLMGGAKADITFTSPPYNVMASGIANLAKSKKIKGKYAMDGLYGEYSDNLSDEEYGNLLKGTLGNALKVSTDVMYNIGIVKGSKIGILDMLSEYRQNFSDLIVWNKNNCLPLSTPTQRHMLSHICEFIFCFNQKGNRSFTYSQWKAGMQTNRIDTKNNSNNEYSKEHSATFPIELPAYVLQNFSQASVLDLFGGTGTTMIAAEQLERKCYMMELDAHYCDIILARWEQFTGKKAEKIQPTS